LEEFDEVDVDDASMIDDDTLMTDLIHRSTKSFIF